MEIKLPIIVNEFGDLSIYETVEAVQGHLETIDVRNGEYVAYDVNGRLLKLEVQEHEKFIEVVRVSCPDDAPMRTEELYGLIWEYLADLPKEPQEPLSSEDTLQSLIKKLIERAGYTK